MADTLGVSASIIAEVTATIMSTKSLCTAVERYKKRNRTLSRLQAELGELIVVFDSLREAIDSNAAILELLVGLMNRCRRVCADFEKAMEKFHAKPYVGLRDWVKMEFMKSDINDFIDILAGYKSTIMIARGIITLQHSRISKELLEDYNDMIQDTVYDMGLHLKRADEKLLLIELGDTTDSSLSIDLQDELAVAEQRLLICQTAQSYVERLQEQQPVLRNGAAALVVDVQSQFEAQRRTNQALNELRDKMTETTKQLQERLHYITSTKEPDGNGQQARLEADLLISRQCLELCEQASDKVSSEKIYPDGEVIAEDETDQAVLNTLSDLFDVRKILWPPRSAAMASSTTDETARKIVEDRYRSRFGVMVGCNAHTPNSLPNHAEPLETGWLSPGPKQATDLEKKQEQQLQPKAEEFKRSMRAEIQRQEHEKAENATVRPLLGNPFQAPQKENQHENEGLPHAQSDNESDPSDTSDLSSIFSTASSFESYSSGFDTAYRTAGDHLAGLLISDNTLSELYVEAVNKYGRAYFERKHDRLLKRLFRDAREQISSPHEKQTIRLLRASETRSQVTRKIQASCQSNDPLHSKAFALLKQQEPDRAHTLNMLLTGRNEADACNDGTKQEDPVYASESSDDSAESVTSQDDSTRNNSDLNHVVKFLLDGEHFRNFKLNLHRLVHPPQTINDALQYKQARVLRRLLAHNFDGVATDKYEWVRELKQVGYSTDEIAELLLEQGDDAPWIIYNDLDFENTNIKVPFHLAQCAHKDRIDDSFTPESQACLADIRQLQMPKDVMHRVAQFCGLAGVRPISRDRAEWSGTVRFEDDNSTAIVTYNTLGKDSNAFYGLITGLETVLTAFSAAVTEAQSAGVCCDRFTILCHPTQSYNSYQDKLPYIELSLIELELLLQLLDEIRSFRKLDAGYDTQHIVAKLHRLVSALLHPFFPDLNPTLLVDEALYLCSLAVQVACLGFLSYVQAHVGDIQPPFLDTPLRKVVLAGACQVRFETQIIAELAELTCMREMVNGPVFTFRAVKSSDISGDWKDTLKYNLYATAEDVLDTWGPGRLMFAEYDKTSPRAIIIGGGLIYPTDNQGLACHFTYNDSELGPLKTRLCLTSKIMIGGLVTVNNSCCLDEKTQWIQSLSSLVFLGTRATAWEAHERSAGIQAGQYFIGQANQTYYKIQGKTLKQVMLEQDDDLLVSALQYTWGVQVSFCTRVARRVLLRELIADMLPVFAKTLMSGDNLWEDLCKEHAVYQVFRAQNIMEWLQKLAEPLRKLILVLIKRILTILQHTGVDKDGKYLTVAWPQDDDLSRCFQIPCQKQSFWARILADSEDCATFAYISSKCLETDQVKCSGPIQAWENNSTLLETAVVRHMPAANLVTWNLEHKQLYFVRKLDSLFLVKVHRPDMQQCARLIASPSTIPRSFQQRLFMREKWKREYRLRERQLVQESAEQVLVSAISIMETIQ